MSKKRKASGKAPRVKKVEAEKITRSKLRLAIGLTSAGVIFILAGLLIGRGTVEGNWMYSARLFMLVIGLSLLLAGGVGLLAHALVIGANRQIDKGRHA
ncbi:MAG: hypothetical protein ABFD13_02700 [Candidatus Cryosericum sp.]|nr:hypothetical protein [bacterium]